MRFKIGDLVQLYDIPQGDSFQREIVVPLNLTEDTVFVLTKSFDIWEFDIRLLDGTILRYRDGVICYFDDTEFYLASPTAIAKGRIRNV